MRDKLRFRRIDFYRYVKDHNMYAAFREWLVGPGFKCKKLKSNNRKAYLFLLSVKGKKWMRLFKERAKRPFELDLSALDIPWIEVPDELL